MNKLLVLFFLIVCLVIRTEGYSQCTIVINASPDNPVCLNATVNFTATSTAGNITAYTWILNGDTVGTGSTFSSNTNFANIELYGNVDTCGIFLDTVKYASKFILNSTFQADYNVIVTECNQPVADIEIFGITDGPIPGTPPYTYDLFVGASLGEQTLYPNVAISTYPLIVTDAAGCIDTTWIDMSVFQCPDPLPTEVITPNDDDIHDSWVIANISYYPDNEVFIFDRWGQRVYHKKGYDNADGWEAKYLGMNMPVSTYYYILKINFEKSEQIVFNGPISVFR